MKRQVKAREEGGWARVNWSFAQRPGLTDMEAVHGRMVMVNPQVCHPLPQSGLKFVLGERLFQASS